MWEAQSAEKSEGIMESKALASDIMISEYGAVFKSVLPRGY